MPGSPKWPLSLRFPHQNPVYTSPLPHTRYMPRPSHYSQFDHPNNTELGVKIIQFHPLPYYLVPLRPKYSPQHPILKQNKRFTYFNLTLRSLTLYIYGAPILGVSRSHTTTQHSR